ncbi:leptin receptor [Pelodytes ibericus]
MNLRPKSGPASVCRIYQVRGSWNISPAAFGMKPITCKDAGLERRSLKISIFLISDFVWKIQCRMKVEETRVTCEINLLSNVTLIPKEQRLNLHCTRLSQNENEGSSDCNCLGYLMCNCTLPSVKLNESYILRLEILNDAKELLAPVMFLTPSSIVKLDPPDELTVEITEQGALKIVWSKPRSAPFDLEYQVKHYMNTSEHRNQGYLLVKQMSVIIDSFQPCSPLFIQIRCKSLHGPGIWSDWSPPWLFNSQDVFYYPQKLLASTGSSASVYCIFCNKGQKVPSKEITWFFNLADKVPGRQYSTVSDYVGKVTLMNLNTTKPKGKFNFDVLHCCIQDNQCHHRYAEIHVLDANINISCETDGRQTSMTCTWDTNQIPAIQESSVKFKYYRNRVYCSETDRAHNASTLTDCSLQSDGFYRCVFRSIYILSGYTMWIEIIHSLGTVYSPSLCVIPVDVVKPLAPSRVHAEITMGAGDLYVAWKRPALPAYELRYQVWYAVLGTETAWKVIDVSKDKFTRIGVSQSCASYGVKVRCQRNDGGGYWSDWSQTIYTTLKDIQAPLEGPDVWRITHNNPLQRGDNITLIWKPLEKEQSLCSIQGYTVIHQISNNASWSEYVGNTTKYTFTVQDVTHSVTVLAINSLGHSLQNSNLTFSHELSTVSIVKSFNVYLINSSCALAMWTLWPSVYTPTAFVVEWKTLRADEHLRWVNIPPNKSRYYIEDSLFALEKFQFSLYPIFAEGTGYPQAAYDFTRVDITDVQRDTGLYVILPIIILSSLLLAGMLMISHQRMKQMFWKDVPNPKYCSWAQGVNFQKPDTLENLFIKNHEHLAPSSSYLLEPDTAFENLSVDYGPHKEEVDNLSIVNSLSTPTEDPDHDSACATSHFSSSCVYEEGGEQAVYSGSMDQSSIKYATIMSSHNQLETHVKERKASASSFDGCSLENKTIVIGNLEGEDQTFFILAGLQPKQPSKSSSNSTISSEGFSEPSDHEESFGEFCPMEQSLYYIGLGSLQKSKPENYFSEDHVVPYPFQENISYKQIDFTKDTSSEYIDDAYDDDRGPVKDMLPYMPQFQAHPRKLQGTSETDIYDLCT